MKHLLFILSLIFISSCSSKKTFPDKDVCFLLYDLKHEKFEEVFNETRCREQFPAASTFKVALGVMAFDSGVFKDETNPVYKWDGKITAIDSWNKDANPTSWMRDSVVWMSQAITPKIGADKIKNYLEDFKYGNQDMSGGLKYAWLTPAPFINEPMQNSLKISGYEQVLFLRRLWRRELKASDKAQRMTQKLMTVDKSHRGNILTGKTGSGFRDQNLDYRLGWFVGHLQTEKSEYIVVINFSDKQKQPAGTFGGREAKELALKWLTEKKLW